MAQSPNRFSIDGFTSNGTGRHVGFDPPKKPAVSGGQLPHVRMRRPGLHSSQTPQPLSQQAAPQHGTLPAPTRVNRRPEFSPFDEPSAPKRKSAAPPRNAQQGRRRSRYSDAQEQPKRGFFGRMRHWRWKKIIKRTSIAVAVLALLCGGWVGWHLIHASSKVFGDGNLIGFLNASKLKGEDKGRVNILLAGVSSDDPGHQGADLTDSIMLISIDTKNNKAFMLSVPRDLWVDVPGYGHAKINTANYYGENDNFSESGYPSGGMGLLEKVVSDNLEVPVNYYAKINYSAFRDMVNAVGGISVNVTSDDPRGFYDPNISPADHGPLKLANGVQTLDGQTALNFARARGDPCSCGKYQYGFNKSDFTRTQNQRTMMLALKDKVSSGSVITNPIKIGELFDAVGKNVQTDFKPSEIRRLYDLGKLIDSKNIQSLSLNDADGKNLLSNYTSGDGASALIPAAGLDDFSDIQLYIKKQMSNDQVAKEAASIVILNGGDITGLASKESNVLTSKGMNVTAVGDAETQAQTTIIDMSKGAKPATKAKLQSIFGNNAASADSTATASASYPNADFVVVLGTAQKAPDDSGGSSD